MWYDGFVDSNGKTAARGRVRLWADEIDGSWFAVAFHGERYVATAVAASRSRAIGALHLPRGLSTDPVEEATPFAREAIAMLARLEAGNEVDKRFELSEEYLAPYLRATLSVAAAIPLGYVATYGDVGSIAGVIARSVGHIMATNPLYPIVPCHRVVGSDMALVGYGGKQDPPALRSKAARLRAEARGLAAATIEVGGGLLPLYPAERVVDRAAGTVADPAMQLSLFE